MSGGKAIGYLFTDIDGSTERWERAPLLMEQAVARHDRILEALIPVHGGVIRDRAGDGIFASFDGGNPSACALAIQLAMQREDWSAVGGLPIRVGVHVGSIEEGRAVDQVSINRAARITNSAWGGQIVVSAEAVNAFGAPKGSRLDDLGFCQLRGIDRPLRLYSLAHDALARAEFPPLRSLAAFSRPLADLEGPFFGREQEIERLKRMIASPDTVLLTLVGPGGNGKTRLAVHLGGSLSEQYAVWFVPLEGVASGAEAIAAIGHALRFPFEGATSHEDQLFRYLQERQGVLILDNAEGLADRAFIARFGVECPNLRIISTSRTPLGLSRETLLNVRGFEAPGSDGEAFRKSPACRLFVHQARAAQPDFDLHESEHDAFRELCAILDGSPLAILLAAQWRHLLTVEGIVARVRKDLDFLRATEVSGPERHHNLRTLFEGSWTLLSPEERLAVARLSAFSGGFDVEAAEAVGRLDLLTLSALRGRGLIEQRQHGRFVMHPLIHEYASEKLAGMGAKESNTRVLHSRYFLEMVRGEFGAMKLRGQGAVLDRVERENSNLLAAWTYAQQRGPRPSEEETEALFYSLALRARYSDAVKFFTSGGDEKLGAYYLSLLANCRIQQGQLEEAETEASAALENETATPLTRAHASHALALVAHARGKFVAARELYQAGLAIRRRQDDLMGCYFSLASLAVLHLAARELAEARVCIKESHQLCQRLGNASGMMIVRFLAGEVAAQEGRTDDAKENYRQSLRIEEELHHPQHRARILISLGALLASRGDYAEAMDRHQQAFDLAIEVGDQRRAASALLELGMDLRLANRHDDAKARLIEAIRIALKLGARPLLVRCLLELARVEVAAGETERATRLASILAAADLGPLQDAFDALVRELPTAPRSDDASAPETAALKIVEEADIAPLLL